MNNTLFMHVIYSFQDLTYQIWGIFLRVWTFLNNAVKKFTTSYSVKNKAVLLKYPTFAIVNFLYLPTANLCPPPFFLSFHQQWRGTSERFPVARGRSNWRGSTHNSMMRYTLCLSSKVSSSWTMLGWVSLEQGHRVFRKRRTRGRADRQTDMTR